MWRASGNRILLELTTSRGAERYRSIFNFINSRSTSPLQLSGSGSQNYQERKIFPYRRSELYKVITDVASYPNFVPYCTGSRILESKTQDGVTMMEAELTVGFLAFQESYTSTVTCKPHEFVEVASSSSSLFKSLTTLWHLKSVSPSSSMRFQEETAAMDSVPSASPDQGPTLVTVDLAFAFANPLHANVSAAFFGQVSKSMVKAFEQRCVALYGTRTD